MLKNRRSSTPTRDKFLLGGSAKAASTSKIGGDKGKNKKLSTASLGSERPVSASLIPAPVKSNHVTGKLETPSSTPAAAHWTETARESVVVLNNAGDDSFSWLVGGADEGQFPHVHNGSGINVSVVSGEGLSDGDVVLEVQGQKVGGYTLADVRAWLRHCLKSGGQVTVKTAKKGRKNMICY